MRHPTGLLSFALLIAIGGCPVEEADDDGSVVSDDDVTGDDDSAPGDDDDDGGIVGGVQVMEVNTDNPPGGASSTGWVWGIYDRPMVGQLFGVVAEMMWEVTLAEGDCVYLDQMIPGFCDPPCAFEEYCTPDNECGPWPVYRPAGEMTLDGLNVPLTLTPSEGGFYILGTGLPEDLFDAGATVTLTAEGDETPAFAVSTTAPPPLEPEIPCELDLEEGEDLVITWVPDDGGATIRWEMISAFHAGDGPMVLCETEDDGSLTVPASIVEQYIPDRTIYETFQLSRYHLATAAVDHGNSVGIEVATRRICFHWPE